MNRRYFLRQIAQGAALAGVIGSGSRAFGADPAPSAPASAAGPAHLKITRVRTILTMPGPSRLCIVKVETSEPGLYGLGCATFTQRVRTVVTAVEEYLAPFLAGKDPDQIEDIWQASFHSSYWRNGPVLMNALSGVDMALWDIKGKRAGMPLYQLLGGRCRTGIPVYTHVAGTTPEELADQAKSAMALGYRFIRPLLSSARQTNPGVRAAAVLPDEGKPGEERPMTSRFEPAAYRRAVPKLFAHLRQVLGDEVELLHDVHERLPPIDAIGLAKELEPYRLFFLEDPFAPEDAGYFQHLRRQCATPLAMGELFNNPNEWLDLVSDRLIDFIRCHISQVGGISVARKIAALCSFYAVRTAWHGPSDVSPVGHAAHVHLDLSTWNFGIQEVPRFNAQTRAVFPGTPEVREGMMYGNEKPGLGIDVDERLAAKYPIRDDPPFNFGWGNLRGQDGTLRRP